MLTFLPVCHVSGVFLSSWRVPGEGNDRHSPKASQGFRRTHLRLPPHKVNVGQDGEPQKSSKNRWLESWAWGTREGQTGAD